MDITVLITLIVLGGPVLAIVVLAYRAGAPLGSSFELPRRDDDWGPHAHRARSEW